MLGRTLAKIFIMIALAMIGSAVMIRFDSGGRVWLKFALYFVSFAALFLAGGFSPARGYSCFPFVRRRTRS